MKIAGDLENEGMSNAKLETFKQSFQLLHGLKQGLIQEGFTIDPAVHMQLYHAIDAQIEQCFSKTFN